MGENTTANTQNWSLHAGVLMEQTWTLYTELSAKGTTGVCWVLNQMPLINQLDSTLLQLPTIPVSGK